MLCCVVCDIVVVVSVCGVVWHAEKKSVYVQNVPVCTSTTRACVETCGCGAGTHGDVLDGHTERRVASSAYQNLPTYGYHLAPPEVHQRKPLDLTFFQV